MTDEQRSARVEQGKSKQRRGLACWCVATGMAKEELIAEGRTSNDVGPLADRGRLYERALEIQDVIRRGHYVVPTWLHRSKFLPQIEELMKAYKEDQVVVAPACAAL